jgi:hypothetical protein
MAYADSEDKQRGIAREPFVAQRILDYHKRIGMKVTMEHSSLLEDMREKIDYRFKCDERQSFSRNEKITEITVDIKCGKTFTLYDTKGRNTLDNAKSRFIVFEIEENCENLIWINTERLKECLKRYPTDLRLSKREGNTSKFFYIEPYVKKNQKFLGNFVKYIK